MRNPSAQAFPALDARTRLLVVAPHPDDETIATGVLVQQVIAAGGVVRVLLLTEGDNNPWPQRWVERRWRIGTGERKRWGRRRRAEIIRALSTLGVHAEGLQCLEWPDMGLTDYLMNPRYAAVDTLREAIDAFGPSLVAMPSLDDRHPDHGAAHVMIRLAAAKAACRPRLLAYLVHGRSRDARYMERVGSGDQQARKRAALDQHQSQMVLSGGRLKRWIEGPERYIEVHASSSQARILPWQPARWARFRLRLSMASPVASNSWRWAEAPLTPAGNGAFQLDADGVSFSSPCFVKLSWDRRSFWIFDHWGWHEL